MKNLFEQRTLNIQGKSKKYKYSPLTITFIYFVFGVTWILFSDLAVNYLFSNQKTIRQISIAKGWVYVLVTAVLIFSLVESLMKKIKKEENKLIDSYQELSNTYEKLEVSQKDLNGQYQVLVEYKEKLYEYAYQDHLTKIPNRRSFYKDLTKKIQNMPADHRLFLMLLDIDDFKYVNDLYGHDYGDILIVNIVNKIKLLIEENMSLYRVGGDEFAILIEGTMTDEAFEIFARSIIDDFNKNFYLFNKIQITLSIGSAIMPDHTENHNDMVKYADLALYKAKEAGKNTHLVFEIALKKYMDEKIIYESKLKQALEKNEFMLFYQPQVDLKTKSIRGFEALIRWTNEDLGVVSPAKFIPIAEETKLIVDIGKWVIEEAIEFTSKLNKEHNEKYIISVNISSLQWMDTEFEKVVQKALEKFDFPEEYLELEVTESILMNAFDQTVIKMRNLRNKGIKLALDDFGTGYSSLNYLKRMPITTLKIDKTFIDNIFGANADQSILNAIISLGHTMGLEVIAEGVETQEQVKYLSSNNCDNIQGYIYSRPLPEYNVQTFIRDYIDKEKVVMG